MKNLHYKQYGAIKRGPERELVKRSATWLRDSLNTSHGWLGLDVPVGSGMPDIAYVSLNKVPSQRFMPHAIDAEILAYTRSSGMLSIDECCNKFLNERHEYLISRVNRLVTAGLLVNSNGFYELGSWFEDDSIRVVTVEAKVSNWQAAIKQAQRNRIFSTHSFVSLPENVANRVVSEEDWGNCGVGLLSVHPDGDVECLLPGDKLVPTLWSYYYLLVLSVVRFPKGLMYAV